MNAFMLISLCLIAAVSAQQTQQDLFSNLCLHGEDTDSAGNTRYCGSGMSYCPSTSQCTYIFGGQSFGVCCNRSPTSHLRCSSGETKIQGVTCGGFVNPQCPDTRTDRCVTDPSVADSLGICCRSNTPEPQCQVGSPLPDVSCGGFTIQGNNPCPDPRYECVGEALAWDGPGYCCLRTTNPEPLRCSVGRPLQGATCGGFFPQPCPSRRRYECVTDPRVPHSQGICCPRQGLRY